MFLGDVLTRLQDGWMDGSGPVASIALSSRVRLARNIDSLPLPHVAGDEPGEKVLAIVRSAVVDLGRRGTAGQMEFVLLADISPLERQVLVEKHLISPALVQGGSHTAVAVNQEGTVSIMVNEEDHLRIQCLQSGLQPREAWQICSRIDDVLEEKIDYAFDADIGYLTACPTNVGTGIRASVMLHLPALVLIGQAGRILGTVGQLGLAVRGLYGEGTEAAGNIFQISNQITLGHTEEEIIDNLVGVAQQIIEQENAARMALLRSGRLKMEDRVWRSYGILSRARILTSGEAMQLFSDIRLGADLGLIPDLDLTTLNELLVLTGPAYLQKTAGAQMSSADRDFRRAVVVREKLAGNKKN